MAQILLILGAYCGVLLILSRAAKFVLAAAMTPVPEDGSKPFDTHNISFGSLLLLAGLHGTLWLVGVGLGIMAWRHPVLAPLSIVGSLAVVLIFGAQVMILALGASGRDDATPKSQPPLP